MRTAAVLSICFLVAIAATAQTQPPLRVYWYPPTQVAGLYWNAVPGATQYTLYKMTVANSGWQLFVTTTQPGWADTVTPNNAVFYKFQPKDAAGNPVGLESNPALVTTYPFTDEPIGVGSTTIRAVHITELRTVVNAVRAAAGLTAATWTYPNLVQNTSLIHKEDVADLRTGFDAALASVNFQSPGYVDPVLSSTVTIKRDHIEQLRERLRSIPEQFSVITNVTNPFFSPNGDGIQDTTTFFPTVTFSTGTMRTDFRWIVNVRSPGGALVRSGTGTGTNVVYAWDGRDGTGTVQPEGTYTFELVDADGVTVPLATALTTIDLTPPTASITAPTAGTTLSNVRQNGTTDITVTGTATDVHFLQYTLDDNLSVFFTGTSPVSPAATLGTWHTATAANGSHTLRLVARDQAGNSTTVTVSVTIANFTASASLYQFSAASGQSVTYTSVLPFALSETLTITSIATGNVVRTLVNAQRSAGTYSDVWDGKNDQGVQVPDGSYKYIAVVSDGTSTMTWDQSGQYVPYNDATQLPYPKCRNDAGSLVACNDASLVFDPHANRPLRINYCVRDGDPPSCPGITPGLVTVKMAPGTETDVTCDSTNCIANEYQIGGAHEIAWYGRSTSGGAIVWTGLVVIRQGLWPINLVFLYGTAPTISTVSIPQVIFNPATPTSHATGQDIVVTVSTYQSQNVTVRADYRNLDSLSILRTITLPVASPGTKTIHWDGRADSGELVAPGEYEVIITATDTLGNPSVIKPLVTVRY